MINKWINMLNKKYSIKNKYYICDEDRLNSANLFVYSII